MNKKEFERREREIAVSGVPEIARHDSPAYESQVGFVQDWLVTTLKRLDAQNPSYGNLTAEQRVETARAAREELNTILGTATRFLLDYARREGDSSAKNFAGQVLAGICARVDKYDDKKLGAVRLSAVNVAYRDDKKRLTKRRTDVLFTKKPVMQTAQRELKKAERYRKSILLLKRCMPRTVRKPIKMKVRTRAASGTGTVILWKHQAAPNAWKRVARKRNIPQEYWPAVWLPEFSAKSFPKWWEFLWPLIKKNNSDLLEKFRAGKFPTLGIRKNARWSKYRREFRKALCTLARMRSAGGTLMS